MAKGDRKRGVRALQLFIRRLQIHLQLSRMLNKIRAIEYDEGEEIETVPEDVKEGHFAILAAEIGEEPVRFVVGLGVLKDPAFLRLLNLAEEEYGFQQKGVLAIPCRPDELQSILQDKMGRDSVHTKRS